MKNRFWRWSKNQADKKRVLRIEGIIGDGDSWYDDSVNPKEFRAELEGGDGDIELWINSPGGDVFAASQIFSMLKEYPGKVEVLIDSLAGSAASVVAMAGTTVSMALTSMMFIHDPTTVAIGNEFEVKAALNMLKEVKESIINAYEQKTKLPRAKLAEMMTAETWFNAQKAVELGFADKILFAETSTADALIFSRAAVTNSLLSKFRKKIDNRLEVEHLYKRLNLIKH